MSNSAQNDRQTQADISKELHAIRDFLINRGIMIGTLLSIPALTPLVIRIYQYGWNPYYSVYISLLVLGVIIFLFRNKFHFHIRISLLICAFFLVGLAGMLSLGLVGAGIHVLMLVPLLITIVYGLRAGLVSSVAASLLIISVGFLVSSGAIKYSFDISEYATSFLAWFNITIVFFFWIPIVISAYGVIYKHLVSSLKQSRASEEQYRALFENSIQAIWIYTCDPPMPITIPIEEQVEWLHQHAHLERCNDTYARMYGFSSAGEILGKRIVDIMGDNDQSARDVIRVFIQDDYAFKMAETHETLHGTREIWHVNSAYGEFENGLLQRAKGFSIDITEKKKGELDRAELETQLRQAQKMEAIGTLAGGIAHDFNNILTVILGNLEFQTYLEREKGNEPGEQIVDSLKAANRAKDLVDQILTFSRKADVDKLPMDIGPICKETLKLLRSSAPATIEISQNIPNGLPRVVADPTLIHQIIMNLCANAVHALKDQSGTIMISLSLCPIHAENPKNGYSIDSRLCLEVSDTGKGIPSEELDKIFLPYYTTKPQGEGTGLGLAVVHGIVKDLGGDIRVQSVLGKGTTFTVTLPVLDYDETPELLQEKDIPTGIGRILIVDDEPHIVDILGKILGKLGYETVIAYDGERALAILAEEKDRIDLIITDYTMPQKTGIELTPEFKRINQNIPVVLISGLQTPLIERKARDAGIDAFIQKPVTMERLAYIVKQHLTV